MTTTIDCLAEQLGVALLDRNWQVSCAESCTGGGVACAITEVSGSSQWFDAGFVTYSNTAKQQFVGVTGQSLELYGAVSEPVVREMVQGALKASGADVAVAISGIAGPDGGTEDKPVGTVWFAWALRGGEECTECCHFPGNRSAVRRRAVERALTGLLALTK